MKTISFLLLLFIVFGLASFGCNDYCQDCDNKCDSLKNILEEYIDRDSMNSDLIFRYDEKIAKFGNIQDSINCKEKSIDSLRNVISKRGKASASESRQLTELFNQLKNFVEQNQELAAQLQQEESSSTNKSLKQLVNILISNVKSKQNEIKKLQNDILELEDQVSGLTINNNTLKEQLEVLETENKGMQEKSSKLSFSKLSFNFPKNISGGVRKAKNIDSLSILFTINPNDFAGKKNIDIYVRIARSDGSVIYRAKTDVFEYNGKELIYSCKTNLFYDGQKTQGCIIWQKGEMELVPDVYNVTFYISNYVVATESFTLTK